MDDWKKKLGKSFNRPQPTQQQQRQGRNHDQPRGSTTIPAEYIVKDSFFNSEGNLKEELFISNPKEIARLFVENELNSNALRHLFGSYQRFATKLRDKRIPFDKAREQFQIFYAERVIRQNKRKDSRTKKPLMPDIVVDFIDKHKELALKNEKEMQGLFRYLTNILCYFEGR